MTALCSPAGRSRARRGLQTSRPGSALTSPAERRPPRRPGPRAAAFGPGCRRRSGEGLDAPAPRAGLLSPRAGDPSAAASGPAPGLRAAEANLWLSGRWKAPKFAQCVTPPFLLKVLRVPCVLVHNRRAQPPATLLGAGRFPRLPGLAFHTPAPSPAAPHLKWARESKPPYFQARKPGRAWHRASEPGGCRARPAGFGFCHGSSECNRKGSLRRLLRRPLTPGNVGRKRRAGLPSQRLRREAGVGPRLAADAGPSPGWAPRRDAASVPSLFPRSRHFSFSLFVRVHFTLIFKTSAPKPKQTGKVKTPRTSGRGVELELHAT